MDVLLSHFIDDALERSDVAVEDYERLLEHPDDQLMAWATGRERVPLSARSPLLDLLIERTSAPVRKDA